MQELWNKPADDRTVRITDYIRLLLNGRWIIVVSFFLVNGATSYFTFTTPPTYEAETEISANNARTQKLKEIVDHLITHLRPKSPISEAYRSLRTQIQYAKTDTPLKTILVSSPGPGERKSTSVTKLAIAIAQMGSKTLLIDADLCRPVIHNLFG